MLLRAAPEGPRWSSDYRKHMACTPFSPEEGIPGSVIPNPDFLHLTANQEVIDIFYKTRISFLNKTIGRCLNPNSCFYEPHRNYPNERRQDNGYLSRDQPHFNGRSRFLPVHQIYHGCVRRKIGENWVKTITYLCNFSVNIK